MATNAGSGIVHLVLIALILLLLAVIIMLGYGN